MPLRITSALPVAARSPAWAAMYSFAYDAGGPLNRLLVEAHNQPDLCGIDIEAATLPWSGGYT
jgi:hypothetical protein